MELKKIFIVYACMAVFVWLMPYMFEISGIDLQPSNTIIGEYLSFSGDVDSETILSTDINANIDSNVQSQMRIADNIKKPEGLDVLYAIIPDWMFIVRDLVALIINILFSPITLILTAKIPLFIRVIVGFPLVIMGILALINLRN